MPNPLNRDSNPNPFQPPKEVTQDQPKDDSLLLRLAQFRKAQKRWSRTCWASGLLLFLLTYGLSQASKELQRNGWASGTTDILNTLACLFLVGGILIIVLGPVSWFWFHKR